MVQVGAAVSYHDSMDEKPEGSWTTVIRGAVKEFVEAVNESSKALASATERFASESLQAVDNARTRSEQSAGASAEMARRAQQAAEDARNTSAGLQAAFEEARERLRNEARLTAEQVASQTAQINEIGAQVKYDLQQRIDEMVARLEAGTAGQNEAMETAQAATAAAQSAAERIEMSVNAVEAAVASARRAAEEARGAADQSEKSVGTASMAVASAQEAAESSRQSASLAEQAGKRSDFAAEASMLLERLETDYSLLTRLVQELHSRISGLSAVSFVPPTPTYDAPVDEAEPEEEAPEAYAESHDLVETTPAWQEAGWAEPSAAIEPHSPDIDTFEPPSNDDPELQPMPEPAPQSTDALSPSSWPVHPPAGLEVLPVEPETSNEDIWPTATQPAMPEPVAMVAPEPSVPVGPSITIFGRVQITISPVPDFDKLLSLDSALARINGVHSVTLADYAREEVIFRVELEKPVSVVEFAHQLSDTAGVPTEVTEASENTLSVRIS